MGKWAVISAEILFFIKTDPKTPKKGLKIPFLSNFSPFLTFFFCPLLLFKSGQKVGKWADFTQKRVFCTLIFMLSTLKVALKFEKPTFQKLKVTIKISFPKLSVTLISQNYSSFNVKTSQFTNIKYSI